MCLMCLESCRFAWSNLSISCPYRNSHQQPTTSSRCARPSWALPRTCLPSASWERSGNQWRREAAPGQKGQKGQKPSKEQRPAPDATGHHLRLKEEETLLEAPGRYHGVMSRTVKHAEQLGAQLDGQGHTPASETRPSRRPFSRPFSFGQRRADRWRETAFWTCGRAADPVGRFKRLLQKAKATFMRKTTCKWVHIHAFLWHGAKGIPERALVGDVLALE